MAESEWDGLVFQPRLGEATLHTENPATPAGGATTEDAPSGASEMPQHVILQRLSVYMTMSETGICSVSE